MTLTVETGEGLSTADAFASLAYVNSYHILKGNETWTGDDALKEAAIRRATSVLNGYPWAGTRTNGRAQALAWPRFDIVDREGYGILSTQIPTEIMHACAELALRELVAPNSLMPDFIQGDAVKREKVGPLEVEYASPATSANAVMPQISVIGPLIDQFMKSGGGNSIVGSSYLA